jgi:hypothetical protein
LLVLLRVPRLPERPLGPLLRVPWV